MLENSGSRLDSGLGCAPQLPFAGGPADVLDAALGATVTNTTPPRPQVIPSPSRDPPPSTPGRAARVNAGGTAVRSRRSLPPPVRRRGPASRRTPRLHTPP